MSSLVRDISSLVRDMSSLIRDMSSLVPFGIRRGVQNSYNYVIFLSAQVYITWLVNIVPPLPIQYDFHAFPYLIPLYRDLFIASMLVLVMLCQFT